MTEPTNIRIKGVRRPHPDLDRFVAGLLALALAELEQEQEKDEAETPPGKEVHD